MPCITLQPFVFQHLTSTITRASLVLACITFKVLIVPCPSSPYNLSCFNALCRHLQGLEEGILRSIISSQILQQQGELATSIKVRFSPTYTKMALVAQGIEEEEEFFIVSLRTFLFGKHFSYHYVIIRVLLQGL
jgi:hypothetical protein